MEPFRSITSRCVVLPIDNIDTDQIVPARFLKVTTKSGLGQALFADWRYDPQGKPHPDFPLNRPEAKGAQVLVAGHNFGCGSSREHAPWALLDCGFRAVITTSIADIFCSNATKNGLLPVVIDPPTHSRLTTRPWPTVTIDLEDQTIRCPDGTHTNFSIDAFARHCLLQGIDQLDFLLGQDRAIAGYERRRIRCPGAV